MRALFILFNAIFSVIAWMAAVVSQNELRAGPKFELKKNPQQLLVASDGELINWGVYVITKFNDFFFYFFSKGFFVNFCIVLLEFCRPFFSSHPSGPKLHLISPEYSVSPACRLDLHNDPCLASGIIGIQTAIKLAM